MTSIPASRSALAMIFAPLSWPSRPGLATTTRILRFDGAPIGADPTRSAHLDRHAHVGRMDVAVDDVGAPALERARVRPGALESRPEVHRPPARMDVVDVDAGPAPGHLRPLAHGDR